MYFWKKSFLTRIRKDSRTLFVTRPTKKFKSMYAHAEVIIKFGVVISTVGCTNHHGLISKKLLTAAYAIFR